MENNTASLRNAAPKWTLAGDKQLLDILQNIHQSLMTRCQEVNRRLDEMVTALDDAGVGLQNVNNKFMALSNNQFIESRVYDDDIEVTTQEQPKELPPPSENESELENIRKAVKALEMAHETIHIVGSDSESDSDSELDSVVLKPKDIYAHRPLPHIIGTPAWRNKWHAGLILEDSDTDSTTSKPEAPVEEYSDSEPEGPIISRDRNDVHVPDLQESTTSSEQEPETMTKPSPAAVAAELARRLRGDVPQMPEEDTHFVPAQPTTKKVYRADQPTTGTIFSDEPPPFEEYQSEGEQYSQEEDDDIFAELHKKPCADTSKVQNRVVEDLFGGIKDDKRDIFDDFNDTKPPPPPVANQKSTLFEDESEPELFASKPATKPTNQREEKPVVETFKKPVGGISLFGSNKGAESIGAAILKRNQRKSSSEDDTASEEREKSIEKDSKPIKNTEKDIFDDLFAKSEREQKVSVKKETATAKKEVKTNKVDLFSDNIFDDIDDIFTTDVVKVSKSNEKQKSLFDDADDDLFSNIAVSENVKPEVKSKTKSIFDSDDDLFSENVKPETKQKQETKEGTTKTSISKPTEVSKTSKSIFDDDSSDSDIFSKFSESKVSNSKNNVPDETNLPNSIESEKSKSVNNVLNNNVDIKTNVGRHKEVPKLFEDEDNDSDNLFNKTNKNTAKSHEHTKETSKTEIKTTKTSLFSDEDDSDLFNTTKENIAKKLPPEVKSKTNNDYNIFNASSKTVDTDKDLKNISHNNNVEKNLKDVKSDTKEISKTESSIFGDDDNDEFLFGNNVKKSSNSLETSTKSKNISNEFEDSIPSFTDVESDEKETISNVKVEPKIEPKPTEIAEQRNTIEDIKADIPESNFESSVNSTQEENSLFNVVKDAVFNTTDDIFSDIMDEPPAFEKPKEPKKSKNVNALFDDDSDDEALFFKKNDVTFDEKPNVDSDNKNDPMFGIFHDEPPAIDIDFTTKTSNNFTRTDSDDNLFKTIESSAPKVPKPTIENDNDTTHTDADLFKPNVSHNNDISNDDLFKSSGPSSLSSTKQPTEAPKSKIVIDDLFNTDADAALFQTPKQTETITQKPVISSKPIQKEPTKSKTEATKSILIDQSILNQESEIPKANVSPKSESQSSDTPDSPEIKKVGKLKTMNFNIDVSTLLPGASPKKKPVEQTDGQVFSTKSQEDLHIKDNIEQTIPKSVSFEGKPDSQILDNKISKERAKIQVKRRPSTRRARKEAVRKSVLDQGEDSTDNSSSFDDAPKSESKKDENEYNHSDNKEQIGSNVESNTKQVDNIKDETEIDFYNKTEVDTTSNANKINDILDNQDIIKPTPTNILNTETKTLPDTSKVETKENINTIENSKPKNIETESKTDLSSDYTVVRNDTRNVTSKVVYILNDEDIFNAPVEKVTENPRVTDTDDDIFRNSVKNNEEPSISTLGNVYKNNQKADTEKLKKSLFDDLSDEENELFNSNKNITTKVKSILDSDSEDDLFGGKKETKEKVSIVSETKDVKPKVEVKASLFGDDDDDDDLFGAKVKINQASSSLPVKTTKEVVSKPTEPVFDDPLSLLGGDDD